MVLTIGGISAREASVIFEDAERMADVADEALELGYLDITRHKELWGGWRREDGRWIDTPALKAAAFHLACRALYCPVCLDQFGRMRRIGFTGDSEHEKFNCGEGHGPFTRRQAFVPRTIAIEGGRQSGKTSSTLPEFCSWQLGYRPWDGTLTAPQVERSDWLLASPSLKTSEGAAIGARYHRMMKRHIVRNLKNDGGWQLGSECANARVHKFSYSQWELAKNSASNPWYDLIFQGALWDEAPQAGAHRATLRGLVKNRTTWGREIIGASFTNSVYLRNAIERRAFNRGGESAHIFCMSMSTRDNPAHDDRAIAEFRSDIPLEQQKAWMDGSFAGDSSICLPGFSLEENVYSPEGGDTTGAHLDDDDSVVVSVDPHSSKPWMIGMIALGEDGKRRFFREWPESNYSKMDRSAWSIDDYVRIIEDMMADLPGGRERVIRMLLDPRAGKTPNPAYGRNRDLSDLLRQKGLVFDTRFSADVTLRLERMRDIINRRAWLVSDQCKNMLWSMQNLHFKTNADGEIIRSNASEEGSIDDEGKDSFDIAGFAAVVDLAPRPWRTKKR